MKKEYIQPVVGIKDAMSESLLEQTSMSITTNSGYGITYGGVDEDGKMDPESRGLPSYSVWDD